MDFEGMEEIDFDGKMDFKGMEEIDFDGKMDFEGMEEIDFDGKMDFSEIDQNDEENKLEPTEESDISQEPERETNADNNADHPSSVEQENKSYENLNSESTSTILTNDNVEEEIEELQYDDQNNDGIEEINQEEFDKEIEKELEEGVEAINKYLEQEAEFINAYQDIVTEARELGAERESEGNEPLKTEEEWEKEVETAAYTGEQLYEGLDQRENDSNSEVLSEPSEVTENEKEPEQTEEVLEPQLSNLHEEFEEGINEIEQHQVEPLIEEVLETEPVSIVNEREIEVLQELNLEEQFNEVHEKEETEELIEWHDEQIGQEKELELKTQTDNSKEIESELEEDFEEEMNEVEQHQVEPLIEEVLETEPKSIVNEKKIEVLQELNLEEQFNEVHEKEETEELIEWHDEQIGQEKETELKTQTDNSEEIVSELEEDLEEGMNEVEQHQVEPLIEEALETEPEPIVDEKEIEELQELNLEEQFNEVHEKEETEELIEWQDEQIGQEKEIELETQRDNSEEILAELEEDFEEGMNEVEQHQVEPLIEEALETEPEPIVNEKELEKFQEMELEEQFENIEFSDFIKDLVEQQEENKIEQEKKDIEQPQEIVHQSNFLQEKLEEQQGELEVEYEEKGEIEQEILNDSEEEDSDQTPEENYENLKVLYGQQTGKRPIYANLETKGFKQWLEQKNEAEQKEKTKQEQDLKEENEEEAWKRTLKNKIEGAREIDPELKSKLIKLVEGYNELEKLIKKYSQLHTKAQRKDLSQTERKELNSLVEVLLNLDPIKMELFLGLQEIKRYIEKYDYYYYEYWNSQHHYKVFSHFFTQLSRRYKSIKEVQKKEIIEEILVNWIEEASEEDISLEMKVVLIKILENYNELEQLASNFMKLYRKEQLGQISQSEKSKLRPLRKTLGKLSPVKIELFANIRAIKRYLNNKNSNYLTNKKHINQIFSRFLKFPLQKYKKLHLDKVELLNMGKIHSEIIKKLKHDFKQEKYSNKLSLSKLANLVKGLSLTQLTKLNSTTKSLRYITYLEFYYFIKQAYENNNIDHEKWREMKRLFKIVFEITTNNIKSIPSQLELENFFFQSYVEPTWELLNSLEWKKYQNSHVLLKRYWRRQCNHIAKILIEYCQKFSNIPFKAYVLKDGESKWREIKERSKILNLEISNLEKKLFQQLNIDLEKDIVEIRLLDKKYQYKYILENSIYNTEDFLNSLKTLISSFIRKNLVKKHLELQINNKLERVNLIRGIKITQYALSLLMEEDKEYIEKVIKQNLRYNAQYIINFACLNRLSKNINSIFKENEKEIKEINYAVKRIQGIIKYYIERNQKFYTAKNQVIIQNHPNIIINYFNRIFDEEFPMEERLEAAYWLGFIYADGYITVKARDKRIPTEFGINLSIKDKSLLVKFCLAIGANPTFIRNVITSEKDGKSYFASIFRISNEKFCKIMENHGIIRKKSKIIELPEQFKSLKKIDDVLKKIFLSFLLGYYDGDGIVNRNTIISGSKKFLKQINNVLVNAFGADLKSKIDERTEGNYYLNIERKIKQNMENVFQNSLERKRRYAKGKYSENLDPLLLKLIIQNLNELPVSEMIKIYNNLIEKHCLPKYLKLSVNNLKRNIALNGYKNHHKEWYINRNLNLRFNTNAFKKKLIELLEKIE